MYRIQIPRHFYSHTINIKCEALGVGPTRPALNPALVTDKYNY